MEKYNVYEDVAKRTDGDIYLGVVGPVRTGKSTFVKRFAELLIMPNISGKNKKPRMNCRSRERVKPLPQPSRNLFPARR